MKTGRPKRTTRIYYHHFLLFAIVQTTTFSKKAQQAENFSQNFQLIPYNDRFHGIIFRLKADTVVFSVKRFYSRGVVKQRDDDISVFSCRRFFHDDIVAAEYAGIDHTVTPDFQNKARIVRKAVDRHRQIRLDLLDGKEWSAGGDASDDRNLNNRFIRRRRNNASPVSGERSDAQILKIIIKNLDRPRFIRISRDQTFFLKCVQMKIN